MRTVNWEKPRPGVSATDYESYVKRIGRGRTRGLLDLMLRPNWMGVGRMTLLRILVQPEVEVLQLGSQLYGNVVN